MPGLNLSVWEPFRPMSTSASGEVLCVCYFTRWCIVPMSCTWERHRGLALLCLPLVRGQRLWNQPLRQWRCPPYTPKPLVTVSNYLPPVAGKPFCLQTPVLVASVWSPFYGSVLGFWPHKFFFSLICVFKEFSTASAFFIASLHHYTLYITKWLTHSFTEITCFQLSKQVLL